MNATLSSPVTLRIGIKAFMKKYQSPRGLNAYVSKKEKENE
jgi:hypothetical protein